VNRGAGDGEAAGRGESSRSVYGAGGTAARESASDGGEAGRGGGRGGGGDGRSRRVARALGSFSKKNAPRLFEWRTRRAPHGLRLSPFEAHGPPM
jgi:hypothetical protein